MRRDDIIKKIRIKMDLDPSSTDDYYKDMYDPLIDEALSVVANTVLPYQQELVIEFGGDISSPDNLNPKKYYRVKGDFFLNGINCYKGGWIRYNDTSWEYVEDNGIGYPVKLPLDFMSYSSESLIRYKDIYTKETVVNVDIIQLNRDTVLLPKDATYTITYNSEYPSITTVDDKDISWLPRNVGNLISSYVAAQLYASEDMTRSMVYKNEFETLLSRLDDNKVLASYSIENSSGWTL